MNLEKTAENKIYMKISRKIILTSYILNAISVFLPIIAFIFLFAYASMLPGSTSDKVGWGFCMIALMIPVLIATGIFFLISVIFTLFSKDVYLYILSFVVIAYYAAIVFLFKIDASDISLVIIFGVIFYIVFFIIFCKCDKKLINRRSEIIVVIRNDSGITRK